MISCAIFFFKQKTAYEMRISDWSSDVCSSDLRSEILNWETISCATENSCNAARSVPLHATRMPRWQQRLRQHAELDAIGFGEIDRVHLAADIGRESCRDRVCQYV